jgi:hypothetical protein
MIYLHNKFHTLSSNSLLVTTIKLETKNFCKAIMLLFKVLQNILPYQKLYFHISLHNPTITDARAAPTLQVYTLACFFKRMWKIKMNGAGVSPNSKTIYHEN